MIGAFAHHLGAALANVVNMINPRRVVLCGWTVNYLGPWLLEPTRARMVAESIAGSVAEVDLVLTAIPDRPVALGMATLALQRFLERIGLPSRPAGRPLGAAPSR
jgi:predicted NBD/HSP70 family sugar kinase